MNLHSDFLLSFLALNYFMYMGLSVCRLILKERSFPNAHQLTFVCAFPYLILLQLPSPGPPFPKFRNRSQMAVQTDLGLGSALGLRLYVFHPFPHACKFQEL